MSNRAYLIGGNTPATPGISDDGINYNPDSDILAGASGSIPILWNSLFKESDIVYHHVKGYKIPSLVTTLSEARQTLISRLSRIHEAFPHDTEAVQNWKRLLESTDCEYIKVDALEVWMLNEEGFEEQLRAAIRWYETGDNKALIALTGLAEGSYDFAERNIVVPDGYVIDYCFHGYGWVREVPWPER